MTARRKFAWSWDRDAPAGAFRSPKYSPVPPRSSARDPLMLELLADFSLDELAQIAEEAGLSGSTLRFWYIGRTKRPTTRTIRAVAEVLGKRLALVETSDGPQLRLVVDNKEGKR